MSYTPKQHGNSGGNSNGGANQANQAAKNLAGIAGIQQQMQNLVHGQSQQGASSAGANFNSIMNMQRQQQQFESMLKQQQQLLLSNPQFVQYQHQMQQNVASTTGKDLLSRTPGAADLLNKTMQQQANGNSVTGGNIQAAQQLQQQLQAFAQNPANIMQQLQAYQFQMQQQQQQQQQQPQQQQQVSQQQQNRTTTTQPSYQQMQNTMGNQQYPPYQQNYSQQQKLLAAAAVVQQQVAAASNKTLLSTTQPKAPNLPAQTQITPVPPVVASNQSNNFNNKAQIKITSTMASRPQHSTSPIVSNVGSNFSKTPMMSTRPLPSMGSHSKSLMNPVSGIKTSTKLPPPTQITAVPLTKPTIATSSPVKANQSTPPPSKPVTPPVSASKSITATAPSTNVGLSKPSLGSTSLSKTEISNPAQVQMNKSPSECLTKVTVSSTSLTTPAPVSSTLISSPSIPQIKPTAPATDSKLLVSSDKKGENLEDTSAKLTVDKISNDKSGTSDSQKEKEKSEEIKVKNNESSKTEIFNKTDQKAEDECKKLEKKHDGKEENNYKKDEVQKEPHKEETTKVIPKKDDPKKIDPKKDDAKKVEMMQKSRDDAKKDGTEKDQLKKIDNVKDETKKNELEQDALKNDEPKKSEETINLDLETDNPKKDLLKKNEPKVNESVKEEKRNTDQKNCSESKDSIKSIEIKSDISKVGDISKVHQERSSLEISKQKNSNKDFRENVEKSCVVKASKEENLKKNTQELETKKINQKTPAVKEETKIDKIEDKANSEKPKDSLPHSTAKEKPKTKNTQKKKTEPKHDVNFSADKNQEGLKKVIDSNAKSQKEDENKTKISDSTVSSTSETPTDDGRRSKRHRLKTILYQSPLPEFAFITKLSASEASNSPKPNVSNEERLVLFYKNEYLAVRNADGGFFLCQTIQNVYKTSPKIRIRWLSEKEPNSCVYIPDFYDNTDIECVLTTVKLQRENKERLKLPEIEKQRIENILKKAIDVEKGILPRPDVTEENPDGLDLSLYKNESQIEKKISPSSKKRNSSKGMTPKKSPKKKKIIKKSENKNRNELDDTAEEELTSTEDDDEDEYKPSKSRTPSLQVVRSQRSILARARAASPINEIPKKVITTKEKTIESIQLSRQDRAKRRATTDTSEDLSPPAKKSLNNQKKTVIKATGNKSKTDEQTGATTSTIRATRNRK